MSKWVIVWCEKDKSYSLIQDSELICDSEHLSVGDEARFFYHRQEWTGVVREVGDDDEYDNLNGKLAELNATNKDRRSSFHVDQPRKATKRFQTTMASLLPTSRRRPSSDTSTATSSRAKTLKQSEPANSAQKKISVRALKGPVRVQKSSQDSEVSVSSKIKSPQMPAKPLAQLLGRGVYTESEESDSDSPASSPTPETIPRELKIQRTQDNRKQHVENTGRDIAVLKSVRLKEFDKEKGAPPHYDDAALHSIDFREESDSEDFDLHTSLSGHSKDDKDTLQGKGGTQIQKKFPSTSTSNTLGKRVSVFGQQEEDESALNSGPDSEEEKKAAKEKKKNVRKRKESQPLQTSPMKFSGQMFRCSRDDLDVVPLKSSNGKQIVYISSNDLKTARAAANAKIFARNLLEGIISDEALYHCTVAGGEFRAAGKSNIVRKPQIDQDAISVILDVAIARQKTKEWKPSHDRDKIKAALRQKLVDIRPKLRKRFEGQEAAAKSSADTQEKTSEVCENDAVIEM